MHEVGSEAVIRVSGRLKVEESVSCQDIILNRFTLTSGMDGLFSSLTPQCGLNSKNRHCLSEGGPEHSRHSTPHALSGRKPTPNRVPVFSLAQTFLKGLGIPMARTS
jgi:hypothetical protein